MVEIAKALVDRPRLLILDEPTAVIAGQEVEALFERLRLLRDEGVAIIYISHRLEEIFSLCDRVTVVKDGQWIATHAVGEVDRDRLVTLMVGRDVTQFFPPRADAADVAAAEVVLQASDIRLGRRVRGASIELRAGIVTGLAGMVGAGRSELAMAIFGGLPMEAGTVAIGGRVFRRMTPAIAIRQGIGFVTEDRKGEGLAMLQDVAVNVTAACLDSVSAGPMLQSTRERSIADADIEAFRIACFGPGNPVATMSGGNQQKTLIARWAHTCRSVLILDEPTRGVDVGARTEIYRIMRELAARGVAILMISSELPEVVGMSDRVYVMREGSMSGGAGTRPDYRGSRRRPRHPSPPRGLRRQHVRDHPDTACHAASRPARPLGGHASPADGAGPDLGDHRRRRGGHRPLHAAGEFRQRL